MVEIRITPQSPEMMAKVIALLTDLNGQVTMAAPEPAQLWQPIAESPYGRSSQRLPEVGSPVAADSEAPQPEAAEPAAVLPEVTLEMVRSKLADLSSGGKTAAVKELLSSFGASKLTDVPQDKFADLLAAAEEI